MPVPNRSYSTRNTWVAWENSTEGRIRKALGLLARNECNLVICMFDRGSLNVIAEAKVESQVSCDPIVILEECGIVK
jgi:prephenate dehydratase